MSKFFVVWKMDRRRTAKYNEDLASTAFNYERDNLHPEKPANRTKIDGRIYENLDGE